jgi:hypothetical protein
MLLISRSGALIGMISTHWRAPRQIPAQTLQLLDLPGGGRERDFHLHGFGGERAR